MHGAVAREDRSATGRRRVFHLLDAIRGLAAFAIAQRHAAWLFGRSPWPSTYLAVDLFFLLSGFVIAHSYEGRLLAGMGWRRFMALRVIRLYPLYVVGLALGLFALFSPAHREFRAPGGGVSWWITGQALLSAGLMLPNWGLPAIIGPRWSLTYELVVNAAYAATVRFLTPLVLCLAAGVSGIALVALTGRLGTMDLGWEIGQAPVALARVGFSFGFGVLLQRLHSGRAGSRWAAAAIALALALAAVAWARLGGALRVELLLVFLAFPTLTFAAASLDVRGRAASVCGALGTTSYALYVIHQPAAPLWDAALRHALGRPTPPTPWAGWSLLVLLGVAAWLLDRWYDGPVRRRLTAALNGRGPVRGGPAGARAPELRRPAT